MDETVCVPGSPGYGVPENMKVAGWHFSGAGYLLGIGFGLLYSLFWLPLLTGRSLGHMALVGDWPS